MLTCIAGPKQPGDESIYQPEEGDRHDSPSGNESIKSLTSQIKDMALKTCNPCAAPSIQHRNNKDGADLGSSDRFRWSYRRTASSNSGLSRQWGKEMEARLKGISSGEWTPASSSGRRVDPIVFVEENDPKEWVAQVEPGVLITFVSMPRGGNDLKRIRFSREMFNKWKAQKWWTENYDRVMELYNVERLSRQAFPLVTTPRSEDVNPKTESAEDSPVTPALLSRERIPRTMYRAMGTGMGYSSSDSLDHHRMQSRYNYDSGLTTSTPKLSSISGVKTETSSIDASVRTSSPRDADGSGELSVSNTSNIETEWVEPGVYITTRVLPGGKRELRRVRFSREKFGQLHAKLWWEENRTRIHRQYL